MISSTSFEISKIYYYVSFDSTVVVDFTIVPLSIMDRCVSKIVIRRVNGRRLQAGIKWLAEEVINDAI